MKKLLKTLKSREKAAYPRFMRQMQYIKSWADLEDYCESEQVTVHLLGDSGYLIITEDEVVDWVGDVYNLMKAFGIIKKAFGNQPFKVDLRECTSWLIMKTMERRGRISISNISPWCWEGEVMYEATITIK